MLFSQLLLAGLMFSETPDTLQAVTVVADRGVVVSRTDTIAVNQSQTITEVLLQSPGSLIGDNGGCSGLKTVSLRGMGSPHTSIYIDGIRVGNVQTGQGDIGLIGLENFSSVIVDYAQNSLSFVTARPSLNDGKRVGGKAKFSAGSFGTYLPSARVDLKLSDRLVLSANAEAVFSKGNYEFGEGQVRENNDMAEIRGGLDCFNSIPGGDLHAKLWFNSSDRGTPGSVSWPSTDRQRDKNVFGQCLLRKQFSSVYHLSASAKVSYDDIFYSSSWGDSKYGQTEAQLNTSHKFSISRWLVLSSAADVSWDKLESTVYSQQRVGTTGSVSAAFLVDRFKADVGVLYEGVFDKGKMNRNNFSPSMDLRYSVFENLDLVAFARRAYRVPTFNELYYVGYGNPELRPEDAWLTDVGIDWKRRAGKWNFKAKIDGFYNILKDKITSSPSLEDPDIWLPYNIGKVSSKGVDLLCGFDFAKSVWQSSFTLRYGFQDAVDKTPDGYSFGEQIPYIARHSLSVDASTSIKGWYAETIWTLRSGRRDSYGEMPDWNTLDIYFRKTIKLGKSGEAALRLSLKNITDNRYEFVSLYPMPGFNILGGIEYKF